MTRLPAPLHRSYTRQARSYGPWSIPGLVERWPVVGGSQLTTSTGTTPAGVADPVGRLAGVLGVADFVQATAGRRPTISATGPAVAFDGADDLLKATYALSMSSRWAMAMAVWVQAGSDAVALDSLEAVTNLSGEYGMRLEVGDNRRLTPMPATWNPNNWSLSAFALPFFASTDGADHYVLTIRGDASNYIQIRKTTASTVLFRVRVGATNYDASLTLPFSAGDTVFVGARLYSGTLTVYADTDGDFSLNAANTTSIPSFGSLTWTAYFGADQDGASRFGGAMNVLLTNNGSAATPITNRFNAGNGMAAEGVGNWLDTHGDTLVLALPGDSDGSTFTLKGASGSPASDDEWGDAGYATVSLTTSTSGVPSRVVCAASASGLLQPYMYAAIATDEKLEIGVRNAAATRTEASSSGAVSAGAHSLLIEFDGTSTLKAYIDTVEVASLAVSGSFSGLDTLTLGGMLTFVPGNPFDERIGDAWLHAGASFPGYTAIDRVRLHNYLAGRTTGLSAV